MPNKNKLFANICAEYPGGDELMDGALADLPKKLSRELEFDSISLEGIPASKWFTLWFRSGAKSVFHVRMIRKGSRCLVEMGGLDASKVLGSINICRDHFDAWFGITPTDIAAYQIPNDRKTGGQ